MLGDVNADLNLTRDWSAPLGVGQVRRSSVDHAGRLPLQKLLTFVAKRRVTALTLHIFNECCQRRRDVLECRVVHEIDLFMSGLDLGHA